MSCQFWQSQVKTVGLVLILEFKSAFLENLKYENFIGEVMEFYRTNETDVKFRLMIKFPDEDGNERKGTLGDGELELKDFISWAASQTDKNVDLYYMDENQEPFISAVVTIQVVWTPDDVPEEYEAPDFDEY